MKRTRLDVCNEILLLLRQKITTEFACRWSPAIHTLSPPVTPVPLPTLALPITLRSYLSVLRAALHLGHPIIVRPERFWSLFFELEFFHIFIESAAVVVFWGPSPSIFSTLYRSLGFVFVTR